MRSNFSAWPKNPHPELTQSSFRSLGRARISQSKLSTIIANVTMQWIFANCLPGQRFAPLPNGNHEPSVPARVNCAQLELSLYLKKRPGQDVSTWWLSFESPHASESMCPAKRNWVSPMRTVGNKT